MRNFTAPTLSSLRTANKIRNFFYANPLTLFLFTLFILFSIFSQTAKGRAIFGLEKPGIALEKIKNRQGIGFLPYWNLKPETQIDYSVIDQLVYFGLTVDQNGNILKYQGWDSEPGYWRMNTPSFDKVYKQAKAADKKVLISIINFDIYSMNNLLASDEAKNNLVNNILEVIQEKDLDGVDIDFEYFNSGDPYFGTNFNDFLSRLKNGMDQINPDLILSADIYPKAIIIDRPYRVKEMADILDQVIMMAYDFTPRGSDRAGPVAPIESEDNGEISITQALKSSETKIDKSKLIMAIPLYGYGWSTIDENSKSQVYWGSGSTVTYEEAKKIVEEKNLEVKWDEKAACPWVAYHENGVNRQIYFENEASIRKKVKLLNEFDLAGIGFWALGYEGQNREVWDCVREEIYS